MIAVSKRGKFMLLLCFTFGDQRREGGSDVMEKEEMFSEKRTDYSSMTVVSQPSEVWWRGG